jgi:pyruvate dehydrogenase E2 component (dihydrolipoamide acetyltransferase)
VITPVLMPQMGLEVTEGTVVEILVELGASVAKDDPVIVLATDKADADIVAPASGVVRSIDAAVGDTVQVGARLVLLSDTADEPLDAELVSEIAGGATVVSGSSSAAASDSRAVGAESPPALGSAEVNGSPRLRVAPVARRAAITHGIALEELVGTGPRGRITLSDVKRAIAADERSDDEAVASGPAVAPASSDGLEVLSPMRRAIARRMAASQREIPQFQLVRDVDVTHLMAQKTAAAAAVGNGGTRAGVNDLLMQAIAEMLVTFPDLAASYVDGDAPALRRPDTIDIGLAVATEGGLLVPVIRRVHERSLREIATDRKRLVDAARAGTLGLQDMTGGVTTLSNLGSFGIDRFTAMVNPGESAIIAVGRVCDRVVPRGRGTAVVPLMTVTLSADHRVVDGATGARALSELGDLLEGAMRWRN